VLVTLGFRRGVAAIYLSVTLIPLRPTTHVVGRGPVPLLGVSKPTARQGRGKNTLAPALKAPRFWSGERLADLYGKECDKLLCLVVRPVPPTKRGI